MAVRRFGLVVAVVVAACGGASQEPTTAPDTQEVGEVALVRSGGIAGWIVSVTVGAEGELEVVVDEVVAPTEPIPSDQLEALHELVSSPEFGALETSYIPPEGVCCDLFFYSVTAEMGDEIFESTTADGVETPPILQQVIDLLSGLIP
jgi:hypothetical protein